MTKSSNKDTNKAISDSKEIIETMLSIQGDSEAIKNAPFVLDFGADYEIELEVPIRKKITGRLLDNLTPIFNKYRSNMTQAEIDLMVENFDFIQRDAFDALPENVENENDVNHRKYMNKWLIENRRLLKEDEAFIKQSYYSAEELELLVRVPNPIDIPQRREDFDLNVKILQQIIDMTKINTDETFKELKAQNPVKLILKKSSDKFWQNQNQKEIARIVSLFRSENI